jgi:hypothetical protein
MKKLLALTLAFLVVAVMGISVIAQNGNGNNDTDTVASQTQVRARVRLMGALGNGLAISQDDPMDFELLRVGIAGYRVYTSANETLVRVGILYFGEDKYKLKDITIGNGSITANIYENNASIGSLAIDSYVKGDKEIWAGPLTLNDVTYNAYIIQQPRSLKAAEKASKIFGYCEEHPAGCLRAMQAIGNIICDPEQEGNTCSESIQTYCEQNPDDRKCEALHLAYCRVHLEDADCRAQLMERCSQNLSEEACNKLGGLYDKIIEKKPQAFQKAPEWLRVLRNRIKGG